MNVARKSVQHDIAIQRAYDEPGLRDDYRVLVDRFWPRGRIKDVLKLDEWLRDIGPSAELIHWFGHDPLRWAEFRTRYRKELSTTEQKERLRSLLAAAAKKKITLVYGARSATEYQAAVLRGILLAMRKRKGAMK